jgi:phage terminase large subunit-like protein
LGFDQRRVDTVCNFFEELLYLTEDEYYGQKFRLLPWHEEVIHGIFGPVDDAGRPLVKLAYLEVPKKSSKTTFCAGLTLAVFVLEATPGCQVYGAGAVTRQALNVYRIACKMVEQQPQLNARLRVMRGTNRIVKRNDRESFYAAVAGDGDFSDGCNPRFNILDELHRWKTRKHIENYDVLSNSGIARRETLTIGITTAGVQNESPLAWRLHEKTLKIEQGVVTDPSFYGRIWAADPKDDWKDERTWIKANPSLKENGGFLDIAKYREKYEATLGDPEAARTFRRYFLNLWDEKTNRAIDMQRWHASAGPWKAAALANSLPEGQTCRTLPGELLGRFKDRICWAGVDLSETTDMTAVALLFPPDAGNQAWDVLSFAWLPAENLVNRERRDGMPYRRWVEEGFLETCPGRTIDYRAVRARLKWAAEMFELQEVCIDPRNALEISKQLSEEDDLTVVTVEQNVMRLNEPTKKVLHLIVEGLFHHGGHPVITWHASCLSTVNRNDLIRPAKPDREKETARIDLMAAAITAMYRAISTEPAYINAGVSSLGG